MNKEYAGGFAQDFQDARGLYKTHSASGECRSPLERLPHIIEKICSLWGKKELNPYVQSLLMDSRGGQRQGFPPEVAEELMMLAEVNTIGRALVIARKMNVPYRDALRKLEAELEAQELPPVPAPQVVQGSSRPGTVRPTVQESPATGILGFLMSVVLSRYFLGLVVVLMVARAFWPQWFK